MKKGGFYAGEPIRIFTVWLIGYPELPDERKSELKNVLRFAVCFFV